MLILRRSNIRQTSLDAFYEIQADGTADNQKERILNLLRKFSDGLTRDEIHDMTGIMYSSTCARIRELLKSGLVYEDGEKINKSGKRAKIIKCVREVI